LLLAEEAGKRRFEGDEGSSSVGAGGSVLLSAGESERSTRTFTTRCNPYDIRFE
jgi:hypothetical protein